MRCQVALPEGQGPEHQTELCRTICETMRADPERAGAMERVLACADKGCDELAECVRAASAGPGAKSASTP